MGRYDLLVTLGRLGLYEMRADSLHMTSASDAHSGDLTTLAAKRVFAIGDPLLLERRARALAEAISVPIETLDLALANWSSGERATLGVRSERSDPHALERCREAFELSADIFAVRGSMTGMEVRVALVTAEGSWPARTCADRDRPAKMTSTPPLTVSVMPLCFIEPQDAIRVIAESVGREARRQLVGEVVRAWVDDIPDQELSVHYAKAIADLDEDDLHLLAAWHASLEVGQPVPTRSSSWECSRASARTAARR